MSLFKTILANTLFLTSFSTAQASSPEPSLAYVYELDQPVTLPDLQDDYWRFIVEQTPELATFAGCEGAHGKWSDYSLDAYAKRQGDAFDFFLKLEQIDRESLARDQRLQYDILKWMLQMDLAGAEHLIHYLAVDHLNGLHLTIPLILQTPSGEDEKGYISIISRMEAVPVLVDQHIALLKKGMETGITQPKVVMHIVPEQIAAQLSIPPEQSAFYQAFVNMDDFYLKEKALAAVKEKIYPAFNKLQVFIANEYIPACREDVGFCALPGGHEAYAHLVKVHTTTKLHPREIHLIGLREVARIQDEMTQVVEKIGFNGSMHAFANFLSEDPNSYYDTKEELLEGFRSLLSKIQDGLPALFNTMPTLPCEIVAVPDYAEASSIMAYYYQGSVETNRPGRFFVNTYNLKDHPKWMMESLTLHEALPGHHFQITLSQLADIPMIQKHSWTTAFVEGWGLYSEGLGKDLGLYEDVYSWYGRLVHEMLRALRLVVDTGLHEFGWTRQQAIDYYKEHLPIDEHEIVNEIDRYIVMPGQALAYKIGELTLLSLREKAKAKEGDLFDIRAFHERLLNLGGCLPLDALERYFAD